MMMSKGRPLPLAVRRVLSGVAIASTAVSVPSLGLAQNAKVEEVVVTGSRIATDPNLTTSSPVMQIKAQEIANRGITRIEDMLNDLPQITPELTANESNGASGTATLDLRGLQSERTLVLTNGHRMGFGDPFELAPDVNQVPAGLVERIELLTGGASSTYGSDAVAGVVNFIMKQDFEGLQLNAQYAGYQHSNGNDAVQSQIAASGYDQAPGSTTDGGTTTVELIIGANTADGRGNITGYLGYRDINAVTQSERDFSACALSSSNGRTCSGSATSPSGTFTPFDANAYFTVRGNEFVEGAPTYNFGPLNYFQRPDERYTAGLFGHYEFSERADAYTEVQFMDDRSLAQIAQSGNFFTSDTISCDNPLLSAQQAAMINALDNFTRDDKGNPILDEDGKGVSDGVRDYPCVPGNGDTVPFYIGRRNVEGGPRFDDLRHTSYRFLGGLRGDLSENWHYDGFANFSRLVFSETYNNDMSNTRIVRALDVVIDPDTGQPACRSALNGVDPNCVPWNIFQEGGVTQQAIDYLTLPLFSQAQLYQDQFVGFVSGDLTDMGLVIPSARDGVSVVFGAEYRGESFDFNPDQGFTSGDGAGQGGSTVGVNGTLNVKELFTEAKVPLVQDLPAAVSLSLDLRYRYSEYSTDVSTDTYNIGGEWTPVSGLMFRGGYSRAARAANIRELFEPQNPGLWAGADPCGTAKTLTPEQCVNTGLTLNYGTPVLDNPAGQYNGVFGGNPNLQPETSDSITIGMVFTAEQWIPNLQFSIDYWSIEIEDAIDDVDPSTILLQCGRTGDAAVCGLINRAPNGNLWVGTAGFVTSTNINIGFFDTSGIDFAANYRLGSVNFSYDATWIEKFDQQEIPGADVIDCAGKWGAACERPRPDYKHTFATTWETPWDVTLVGAWRFISGVDELSTNANAFDTGSENYIDVSATFMPDFAFGAGTVIRAGINNLLDNDPPVNGRLGNVDTYGNGNTIPGTWDALGRYYFVGLTQNF